MKLAKEFDEFVMMSSYPRRVERKTPIVSDTAGASGAALAPAVGGGVPP